MVSKLAIASELTCPICLNILRDTVTTIECLHRFCNECITTSLRLGKKECPTCRVKCPSRRSLRRDEKYDAIIKFLFPDLSGFQKEQDQWIEKMNKELKNRPLIRPENEVENISLQCQIKIISIENEPVKWPFLRISFCSSIDDISIFIQKYISEGKYPSIFLKRNGSYLRLDKIKKIKDIFDNNAPDQEYFPVYYSLIQEK